jgi:hypothetical protein
MDEELDELILLCQEKKKAKPPLLYQFCEQCGTELLLDDTEYVNVCVKCGIGYPYCEHYLRRPCSPPYKRKWHFMTAIRRLNLRMKYYETESLLASYINFDRHFSDLFPGKNMMNLDFTIKTLADQHGFTNVSEQISLKTVREKTLACWRDKFDLVYSKVQQM